MTLRFEVLMSPVSLATSFETDSPAIIFAEAEASASGNCKAVILVLGMFCAHAPHAQVVKYGVVYLAVLVTFVLLIVLPVIFRGSLHTHCSLCTSI